MKIVLVLAVTALLSGCGFSSFVRENPEVTRAGVQFGGAKYIRLAGDAAAQTVRRDRFLAAAEAFKAEARGSTTTVAALKATALAKIPADTFPEDRIALTLAIDLAAKWLLQKVGEGELTGDQLLPLDDVVGWFIEGATLAVPQDR